MKMEIKKYIDDMNHTVMVAVLNYEIWWTYKEKESRKKYIDTMNHYTMFFQTSIHAHFVALLVALYRLYETGHDTINIPELIKLLEKNESIPQNALNEVRQLYQETLPLCKKVSILRNNAFGHHSNKYSVSEVFQKVGATPNELKDLIERTKELLNNISHVWGRSVYAFDSLGTADDINRLLEDLKQLRETRSNTNVEPTS